VVKLLIERDDVEINSKASNGQTPLSLAAVKGYEAVVKLLLATDAVDPDSKDARCGRTPLSRAAGMGHEAVVNLLLAKDIVDPNSQDRYDQTPLLLAAGNDHEAAVKLLLATDVIEADSKDEFDRTPLSWAAKRGNSNVFKVLLQKYEENGITIRDKEVNAATSPAADYPSRINCDICMLRIPDVDIHYHCGMCLDGDFDICQECIANGAFCFDQSHKLIKRTVKDGTLMEVPD
jgi:ankyrin repeat protein